MMRPFLILTAVLVCSRAEAQFAFFDDGGTNDQFGICYPDGGKGTVCVTPPWVCGG